MKPAQISVLKLRAIFLKLYQNHYMHEISTNFETGLTRYNVCTLITQLSLYLWFSPSQHPNQKTYITSFWSHTKLNLLYFQASDNVVPIQPGDTSNVEETSYFTARFALHKMFKTVARFVNAAINKTRDKVGIDCILWRVWNFLCLWYDTMIITLLIIIKRMYMLTLWWY